MWFAAPEIAHPGAFPLHPDPTPLGVIEPPAPPGMEQLLALLQKTLGHELPNQLIAVQGLARLLDLEAGATLNPDCQDYLQRLAAAAQRAHETVRALGDFLRAIRTDRPVVRIALGEIVREVCAEVGPSFPGLTVEHAFPAPGPFVSLPAFALRQIVLQLLRHAHQGAGPGGTLTVSGHEVEAGVELRIHDNGPPLPAEAEATPCGLGLALARQLLANWRATLAVQSLPEQGNIRVVCFLRAGD